MPPAGSQSMQTPPAPASAGPSFASHRVALPAAMALLFGIVFLRVLFLREVFVDRDTLIFTAPSREYLALALREGRIPEWCDLIGLGSAFAANPLHGVTNPVLWLLGLLPVHGGYDLLSVACLAWAAMGTAAVARELGADGPGALVAGALFGLGGYAVSVLPNASAPMLAWTPWTAWAAYRLAAADPAVRGERLTRGALFAAVYALQLMAGEPAQIVSATALALAVTLARAPRPGAIGRLVLAGAASLPLAALVLLPGLGRLGWSQRGAGLAPEASLIWSLHPLRLLEVAWPGLLGDPLRPTASLAPIMADASDGGNYMPSWASSIRLGLPALLLAMVAARRDRRCAVLFAAAVGFVLLALGRFTPIYGAFRALVVPERLARFPEKHFTQAALLMAVLAGVGFSSTRARGVQRGARLAYAAALAVLAAGVVA